MSKKDEALKLALDDLESIREILKRHEANYSNIEAAITAIKEAMAEQPAQGCEFCSHPLYAGTKCKNCGKPAQQDIHKIGCVNHDCDQCKAQQQEIDELTAQRDFLADILTRTANALKGQPAELSSHSWHDLPEVAQQLKAAQQQAPATWMRDCADFWEHYTCISEASQENYKAEAQMWVEKLRTSPPASKPLPEDYTALEQALTRLQKRYADLEGRASKPLTDEQIDELARATFDVVQEMPDYQVNGDTWDREFARAIEAAHGIKGGA